MSENITKAPKERMPSIRDEQRTVKQKLDAQPKRVITLYQARAGEPKLPDKFVQIEGYGIQIQRGVPVEVAEDFYLALVCTGEVAPQRQEDMSLVPQMTYTPGVPISEQTALNVQ